MYTVGALAKTVGLTRSTLLYYDRVGLLRPSRRSATRYRLYDEDARVRLASIRTYREVGLGLAEIRTLLDARGGHTATILGERLEQLNEEIAKLREQQRVLVRLLEHRSLRKGTRAIDKERWVEILAAAGLDAVARRRWHHEFEVIAPEAHQDFLESLGISLREITAIRAWSRKLPPRASRDRV